MLLRPQQQSHNIHQASANMNSWLAEWPQARNNAEGSVHMCCTRRQGHADIALSADFINKTGQPEGRTRLAQAH
jgi:hypothetical protein